MDRRVTWLFVAIGVLASACVGGGAASALLLSRVSVPAVEQVAAAEEEAAEDAAWAAAEATRLVAPDAIGNRSRLNDPATNDRLKQVQKTYEEFVPAAISTVAAAYGDPQKRDVMLVLGVTAPVRHPEREIGALVRAVTGSGARSLNTVAVAPGPLGGAASCGFWLTEKEQPITVCAWSDSGSVGAVVWVSDKVVDYSDAEFRAIREQIEHRS